LVLRVALCLALGAGVVPARAQESPPAAALITTIDSSQFPEITAYLRVNDAAGSRVAGLTAQDFRLIENDVPVSNLTVTEQVVGVQVVFVLDPNDSFSARDVNAVTRLDYLQQALTAYAQDSLRARVDDVTILASEGPVVAHASDSGVVARALEGYTSTFTGVADPFTLINWGLDFAADSPPRPGMRRLLIFISNGLPRPDSEALLADAATRAAAAQVSISTLYVGPAGSEATTGATNLRRLAERAGGLALNFAGAASLDPFITLLAEQGEQYTLAYRSTLAATGQHRLAARVALPDGEALSTAEAVFPLRIEPPRLSLGPLPASVVRVAPFAEADPAAAEPTVLDVPLVVDFPDGHPRGLHALELVVDGTVVASLPPGPAPAAIAWPLAAYAGSGDHVVQAHLVDELGLAAESDAITMNITLQVPAAPPPVPATVQLLAQPGWPLLALALSGLLLAVGVGVAAWWGLTRAERSRAAAAERQAELEVTQAAAPVRPGVQPGAATWPRNGVPPGAATRPGRARRPPPAASAPVAQAEAPAEGERAASPAAGSRWHLPHIRWRGRAPAAPVESAYLEVVESGGGSAPRPDIELLGSPLTLGRDAAVAETVFHDRSVSRLHARIMPVEGGFRLFDAGSTSGTWVNYTPLAAEAGHDLQHGDLINLGRVQLRFKQRDASANNGANSAHVVKVAPAPSAALTKADEKVE
jgi:hypothetical protein